ncbi:MAG: Wzz/FepE/Etk N-terminal domain-containing protein [Candidatus Ratteibacteria bacterium]|nr:Wzz/FepE/Etk N-terminal domain-containing protein [Candidatus Ratteibacteria bacterium]
MNNDTIEFRDYLRIIRKRKIQIIVVFLITVLAATIISLTLPPVYKATVSIQNGTIIKNSSLPIPVVSQIETEKILKGENILQAIIAELNLNSSAKELQKNIRTKYEKYDTNTFQMQAEYKGKNTPTAICSLLAKHYISQGEKIIDNYLEIAEKEINLQIEKHKQDIERMDAHIEKVKKSLQEIENLTKLDGTETQSKNIESLTAVFVMRDKIEDLLQEKENALWYIDWLEMTKEKTASSFQHFTILKQVHESEEPVRPKVKLNIIVSMVFGLLLGILLSFIGESYSNK